MKKLGLILAFALTPMLGGSQQVLSDVAPSPDAAIGQEGEEHPEEGEEHPEKGEEHPEKGEEHPEGEGHAEGEEHPEKGEEHPEKGEEHHAEGEEHPEEGEEHPEEAEEESEPPSIEAVAQFLEAEVAAWTTEQGGWMKVRDDVIDGDLALQLDKIHRERLSKTSEGTYFVCADFTTPEGKSYDLDFWVKDAADGLMVAETTIHKEEGEARYMWFEEDGVWVRN